MFLPLTHTVRSSRSYGSCHNHLWADINVIGFLQVLDASRVRGEALRISVVELRVRREHYAAFLRKG